MVSEHGQQDVGIASGKPDESGVVLLALGLTCPWAVSRIPDSLSG